VDRHRPDVQIPEASPEGGLLARRLRASPPRGRVVGEDLQRVGADLVGALDRLDHAAAEREVGAEASAVWEHPRHGTTWRYRPQRWSDRVRSGVRSGALGAWLRPFV